MSTEWDDKQFDSLIKKVENEMQTKVKIALEKAGDTLLDLSSHEVPLNEGTLLQSGNRKTVNNTEVQIGYNSEYAAFQHEGVRKDGTHQIKHYNNGRKKKYLEDPLYMNKDVLIEKVEQEVATVFK